MAECLHTLLEKDSTLYSVKSEHRFRVHLAKKHRLTGYVEAKSESGALNAKRLFRCLSMVVVCPVLFVPTLPWCPKKTGRFRHN